MCCISAHGLMLSQAACACIAELGAKIDKKAVQPYVSTLLAALIESFHDQSWPVRDASCLGLQ